MQVLGIQTLVFTLEQQVLSPLEEASPKTLYPVFVFVRPGLSLNPEYMDSARLYWSYCLFGQHWGSRYTQTYQAFHVGTGDLNSGPPVCVACTLLTEPSPQL